MPFFSEIGTVDVLSVAGSSHFVVNISDSFGNLLPIPLILALLVDFASLAAVSNLSEDPRQVVVFQNSSPR